MAYAPAATDNPYERILMNAAAQASRLHDAAQLLMSQATRRLQWAEREYQKEVKKKGINPDDVEPPTPPPHLVNAIRGASDVMDKSIEAQALCLGIQDVMKMQASGGAQA